MSERRLFSVKNETWWDVSEKKTVVADFPTIRPYRRRSWTDEAMRAAWAYLMAQPDPTRVRIGGSNTVDVAKRLGLMTRTAIPSRNGRHNADSSPAGDANKEARP